jgi:hypothetical protein
MNCLAHAIRFLDDKWFMIGTGLPDWLGMADRKVRIRPKHTEPIIEAGQSDLASMCLGIQQHWVDDDWFHTTPAFHEVTGRIGKMFKEQYDSGDNYRSGFVGHIACELLIDGILAQQNPGALDRYYELVRSIDATDLQNKINSLGARKTDAMTRFLDKYSCEQFLRDYLTDDGLLYRLNRVLTRVRLGALPDSAVSVVAESRVIVREELDDLLSAEIRTAAACRAE